MIQDVIAQLKTAGFRFAGVVGGVVVGDRKVPGMPHTYRVCGAWPERDGWHGRLTITQPNPNRAAARIESVVTLGGPFADADAFGWWLGHGCSTNPSPAEVAAILESKAGQTADTA